MTFYFFIDESGDHGLKKLNHEFPVFLLCGILVNEEAYYRIRESFNSIKNQFWGNTNVIFHSRDIRKCEKEFVTLLDSKVKNQFYDELNWSMIQNEFTVFASAINKKEYVAIFGELHNDIYEQALTAVFNQIFMYLLNKHTETVINVIIEKRGKKEDRKLEEHFKLLRNLGTEMFSAEQIANCNLSIQFRNKKENNNGLQLADLTAYPIARFILNPEYSNLSFEIIEKKIFKQDGKLFGLRIIP
jgi:hypothetical protein